MRINPQYIQDLVNAANQNSVNQQKYTTEIATGVSVNSLSDNPSAAAQDFLLRSEISSNDNFVQTASGVSGALQVTDTVLGGVVTQITQAISLATEGNNGTLNASDLSSIANQLTGVRSEILSLANTSYQGQFVFSGSQTSTQPFSLDTSTTPASVVYSGDSVQTTIQSPSGQRFPLNVPGSQIFGSGSTGILATLNNLIVSFSSGSADIADTTALNTDLQGISQQRVIIDNSISGLQSATTYTQNQTTQLQAVQNSLIQADTAQVATQLSTSETQGTALLDTIAGLEQLPTLFTILK
ncbi:MAG TPA: flagellar hook-associated protein FlgL [Acidobacteriaceae bacterium]|nr:flagellar hook-associated protein FlgL [Acidobacteriaceae bacterium]